MFLNQSDILAALDAGDVTITSFKNGNVQGLTYVLTVGDCAHRLATRFDFMTARDLIILGVLGVCVVATMEPWAIMAAWLWYVLDDRTVLPVAAHTPIDLWLEHRAVGRDDSVVVGCDGDYFTLRPRQTIRLEAAELVLVKGTLVPVVTPHEDWAACGITVEPQTLGAPTAGLVQLMLTNRNDTTVIIPVGANLARVSFAQVTSPITPAKGSAEADTEETGSAQPV